MRAGARFLGISVAACLTAGPAASAELKDLYFGEAFFHAYQGRYFDALERLDTELAMYHGLDEPGLDTLHPFIGNAEFSVGDFELDYRMHHRAGRAIKAVLEGAVDPLVRNEAAFRLARIHFQKGQFDDAVNALSRIQGPVPEAIRDDVEFLRANVDLAMGKPAEAVTVLEDDFALTREDPDATEEPRLVALGLSDRGNLLVVVYAYREPDIIRVISAWKANQPQRRQYEKNRG